MQDYGFDGVDLDWEPVETADQAPLKALAVALKAAKPGLLLSVPVNFVNANFPGEEARPSFAALAQTVDRLNIMSYGMAGVYEGWKSWHSSALTGEGDSTPSSVDSSVKAYLAAGIPASKLGVGIGFYGLCYQGVLGPNQSAAGMKIAADDGQMSYANIMGGYFTPAAKKWDAAAKVPYLSSAAPLGRKQMHLHQLRGRAVHCREGPLRPREGAGRHHHLDAGSGPPRKQTRRSARPAAGRRKRRVPTLNISSQQEVFYEPICSAGPRSPSLRRSGRQRHLQHHRQRSGGPRSRHRGQRPDLCAALGPQAAGHRQQPQRHHADAGRRGGATTAPGGANQKASLEGCLGETLFNGVWRMTVNSFKPGFQYDTHPGYVLNLEWKNGTTRSIDALNTGLKDFMLVLADGTTLTSDNLQQLTYRKLPQAGGMTFNIPFYADDALPSLAQPSKLLVEIDPSIAAATSSGVSYTTPTPSFRVRLDCAASSRAPRTAPTLPPCPSSKTPQPRPSAPTALHAADRRAGAEDERRPLHRLATGYGGPGQSTQGAQAVTAPTPEAWARALRIEPQPAYSPMIGVLVEMLAYARLTTLQAVEGMDRAELDTSYDDFPALGGDAAGPPGRRRAGLPVHFVSGR